MLRFVCCRWGDWPDEYIDKLKRGIKRHYSHPHWFEVLEGTNGWPREGYWPKMELYRPGFVTGRTVYIDLDSVIVGSLDWLRDFKMNRPMASPMFSCKPGQIQSSVIVFRGDDVSMCYDRTAPLHYRHDQSYMTRVWREKIGDLPAGVVASYKWATDGEIEEASIVQFHGRKKPHQLPNDPIVKRAWL